MPNYPYSYQPYQPYQPYIGPYYQQPPVMAPYSGQATAPVAPQTTPVNTQPVQNIQPPIQNGGFIAVRGEMEARNWPVAPGNSVTFKDETAPYVYTKTATYNQLEAPQFIKYRLEREDDPQNGAGEPTAATNGPDGKSIDYAAKEDVAALAGVVRGMNDMVGAMQKDIETMKGDMYGVVGKKSPPAKKETVKKEESEDA